MTIELVIFDLDGVLIDSRDLHYDSLNMALSEIGEQYVIGRTEHLSTYDGLSTTRKLEMLSERKGLPKQAHNTVWRRKQDATITLLDSLAFDQKLIDIMRELRGRGIHIAVASNSIRATVKLTLLRLGIMEYVDVFVSNQDVTRNKPWPDMYWQAMTLCNTIPARTLIIEDSHIGRQAAIDSGAHLLPVENSSGVTMDRIIETLDRLDGAKKITTIPWRDPRLNVLIPMAGAGSRFASAGYTFPKPLIDVHGQPMIKSVVDNLNIEAQYTFIVQRDHYERYSLQAMLNIIKPGCNIVQVDGLTQGAACTTLLARHLINNDQPLLIANSDQWVEWNSNECMYAFTADGIDGGILTFENSHPKWSYAKLDGEGFVTEIAEKRVISNHATVGIYYWRRGRDYVRYADQMIARDTRVNGEFYVAPVYNEAIADGAKLRVKDIGNMWGLGTPEDLNYFLGNHPR